MVAHVISSRVMAVRLFGRALVNRLALGCRHQSTLKVLGKDYPTDEWTNVPPSIIDLLGRNLHKATDHPIGVIREIIEGRLTKMGFTAFNDFTPVVSKHQNFDSLGFPEDHPGRAKSDTYYINAETLLRTHTSAHEIECLQAIKTPGYLISADVFRRDTIDRTHYPAFHQMEGGYSWDRNDYKSEKELCAAIQKDIDALPKSGIVVEDPHPPFNDNNPKQVSHSPELCTLLGNHLKRTMEIIMGDLFTRAREAAISSGQADEDLMQPIKARWIEAYFPWTGPSWEIEIWWKGEWLEMCGCGVVQQALFDTCGQSSKVGWAFGIGLERSAMILFGIPDIRLFWSKDPKFTSQFKEGSVSMFRPWSKFPASTRDVAFWTPNDHQIHENDVMEIIRSAGGDLVEGVSLVDTFTHPKTGRTSQCYRINYRSMERNLTNQEVNEIQKNVEDALVKTHGVEIR